MFNKQYTAIMQ